MDRKHVKFRLGKQFEVYTKQQQINKFTKTKLTNQMMEKQIVTPHQIQFEIDKNNCRK